MKYTIFKYPTLKRRIFVLFILLALSAVSHAQNSMKHEPSAGKKNIFLMMMDTMMLKMNNVLPDNAIERDFILQMIPHHEGAIVMAAYEIRIGKDFGMIQLAKSIVAEQANEIQQMNLWLKDKPANLTTAAQNYRQLMNGTMQTMMDELPANTALTDTDKAFAAVMIPHHQAAINMAKVALTFTHDPQTKAFANRLISAQQIEIEQMASFLKDKL